MQSVIYTVRLSGNTVEFNNWTAVRLFLKNNNFILGYTDCRVTMQTTDNNGNIETKDIQLDSNLPIIVRNIHNGVAIWGIPFDILPT
jgi:hypothetical protein